MDDLISRQAAIDALLYKGQASRRYKLGETWELNFYEITEAICSVPSAEPEIIMCKDCRHNGSFDTDCPISWPKDDEDYCSYAER